MANRAVRRAAVFAACAALAAAGGYGLGRLQLYGDAAAAPAASAPGAEAAGPFYVEVGQLMVPVLVDGRTTAFILTQVTLEAAGAEQASLIRRRLPHARNALLQGLFGLAGAGAFDGPAVDPAAAARALKQAANEQLGAELVKTVLIDRLLRQENTRG
jgi:flagellar FliL protein